MRDSMLVARGNHHLAALAISAVLTTLLGLAVWQSGGGWREARMGGLLAYNLLSVIAGLLFYITWRLAPRPAIGWLAVIVLGVSLSELPFMMIGFVSEPAGAVPGGEFQEVLAVWVVAAFCVQAARGVRFGRLTPLFWAVATGVLLALVRALGVRLGPDTLAPTTWLGVTQRVVILAALVVTVRAVWRTTELDRRFRIAYVFIFVNTSLFALNDTGIDWLGPKWGVVVTVFFMIWLAQLQVEAALTVVARALAHRQQEIVDLAVRAATARELVDRGETLLDVVRSSVGPLAQASNVLERALPETDREVLAQAMRREIERVNRALGGSGSDPRAFPLDEVVGPLVQFQHAQGHTLTWHESGMTVVHDPDTVARAVGVALSTVAASSAGISVQVVASGRVGDPVHVRVLPECLAVEPCTSVHLQEAVTQVDSLSTATLSALRSVQRLLQTHGGGLRVQVPVSGDTGPGFELSLPLLPTGRGRPIHRS